MKWSLVLPWVITISLIVIGYIMYSRDEKKLLKKVEDEMQQLFEKEFKREFLKNIRKTDRRGSEGVRKGRRSYEKDENLL